MQITHQEARQLIQFRSDQVLKGDKKTMLSTHLKDCLECADYANQIRETEAILRTTLQKHWNVQFASVQVNDIKVKTQSRFSFNTFLTTRSALVGVTLLFFVFGFLQFITTSRGSPSSMTIGIPVIPTPSLPLTSTQNNFDNCQMIWYEVRQNDTVESLAHRFFVSEDVIRDFNNLHTEVNTLPSLLIIPICDLTPTGTTHPPTSTTNTPELELITYTPG